MGLRGPQRTWTPLKRSMLESSIWRESADVCKLWVTLLLIADEPGRGGHVDMPLDLLAARARMTEKATSAALARLMSPDPLSRSRNDDGRRVALIDPARPWGWRLLNWQRHRISARVVAGLDDLEDSPEDGPESAPERKLGETFKTSQTHPKGREGKGRSKGGPFVPPSVEEWLAYGRATFPAWPTADAENAFDHYVTVGWVRGKNRTPIKDWRACAKTCFHNWLERNPNVDPNRVIL